MKESNYAYDRQNYSWFLTYYCMQMMKIPETHPRIYRTEILLSEEPLGNLILLIIAKQREGISIKDVLSYYLSPIPWSLALPDDGQVKVAEHCWRLSAGIRQYTVPEDSAMIVGGMVVLQNM